MNFPRWWLCALALLCGASVSAQACDAGDAAQGLSPRRNDAALAPGERDAILALHNRCRRTASPRPEPPLAALRWNEEAAAVAQRWARQCVFEHNAGRGHYGENIAFATDGSLATLLHLWLDEAPSFSYAANRCTRGMCGHYTQVVSRRSTSVGCGAARCPFGRYLVCDYDPPGNIVGRRPY